MTDFTERDPGSLMRIEVSSPPTYVGRLARAPLPQWSVGAIVEATAVRAPGDDRLWLTIGQVRLPARLASGNPSGPANGETLRLRVLRNSPVLAFEALDALDTAGIAAEADVAGDALRRALPRQSSPTPLLASLDLLASALAEGVRDEAQRESLPPRVAAAVAALWEALPDSAELQDAGRLSRAVERSGLQMESRLAQLAATATGGTAAASAAALAGDFKALLIRLQDALRAEGARPQRARLAEPSSGTRSLPLLHGALHPLTVEASALAGLRGGARLDGLARETEGTLARLMATQLGNAAAAGSTWLVEVPCKDEQGGQLLRFRFEREPGADPESDPDWSVEVALGLPQGEAVHARIALRNRRVSVQLRSDSAAVVATLRAYAPELVAALQAARVNVDQVMCMNGMPVADVGERRLRLLDVSA